MDNSTRGHLPVYNEKRQDDRKKWVKFAFFTAVVTVGTYYGAGRYIKEATKKLDSVNTNVVAIGQFMEIQSGNKEAFLQAQREAISAATARGTGFTYYPGLGVLHHDSGK